MLLYFGPEVTMPLASAAAAVGGILLLFWRRFIGFLRMAVRAILRRNGATRVREPHDTSPAGRDRPD